jgi:hypothetical protein
MEEKLKSLLTEMLVKTLGKKKEEIQPLLTEEKISEALPTILSWDAERVDVFKKKEADGFERGYKKANGEVLSKFEKEFKEKFHVDSTKTGIDLIEEYITSIQGSKTITDEQVKAHPTYIALEKAAKAAEKRINDEWEQKLSAIQAEQHRKEVFSYVQKEAMGLLESLNPVLPDEADKKQNQLSWFNRELQELQYEIRDGENGGKTIFILDKDGKRLENKQGYPKDFKEHITEIASKYWTFSKTKPRSAEQPKGEPAKPGAKTWESKIQLRKPTSNEELQKLINEINSNTELSRSEKLEAQMAAADLMNGRA